MGRPTRALRIHLGPPFRQLRQQIGVIEEPALLEERAFDPADQIFDGSFLPRAGGPADFNPEPEIERHARKQRIPFGDLSVRGPRQRDGFRPIEHRQERNPPDGGEVIHQCADERLRLLIRHDRHLDPSRVLEPRCEKVDALLPTTDEPNVDVAEVVLREFPGEPFEAHERAHRFGTQLADQIVERGLPAPIAFQLRTPQHFHREQIGVERQRLDDKRAKRLRLRGSANPASLTLAGRVDVRDHRFTFDALDASTRDAGEPGDFDLTVTRALKNLNLVAFEHVDHPFPRCLVQRVCDSKGLAQTDQNFRNSGRQNFRKTLRQNFRNPHCVTT